MTFHIIVIPVSLKISEALPLDPHAYISTFSWNYVGLCPVGWALSFLFVSFRLLPDICGHLSIGPRTLQLTHSTNMSFCRVPGTECDPGNSVV